MPSLVSQTPAALAADALAHFSRRLSFETDCSDVYHSQREGEVDYLLVDVRGAEAFAAGHIPGAINLPQRTLTAERLAAYPASTLFVVYCAGPHCNGVHRAAVRLAGLGFAVKEMLGGVTGWLDEGFTLTANEGVNLGCGCA
ncbi:rhodanese-like domain-containing protein [Pseudomonas sp. RIT-PI-S]|uniref:rhodanese-like domain-containing protein n=1 Tax=Pseudomonas sp. RIT-PI-S TaxID=3035295 RepID=UPI0021D9FB73|nr:rhodanese-like domain-containing protein [Pseudomonas sp. RIT-PI-S]